MGSAIQNVLKSDTLLLNVAIVPPDNVAITAIELSKEAQNLGGLFLIDNITKFSHMTLYMARFHRSELDSVHGALLRLRTSLRQQAIKHTGYFVTPGNYYEISYARSPALLSTHEAITQALSEFRFSPGHPVIEKYFGRYSSKQEQNAKRWGYDLVGEMYRPHVTLTHFPVPPERGNLPTVRADLSFTATEIGLFEADEVGAARKWIARMDLVGLATRP